MPPPRFWRVFGVSGLGVGELQWQFSPWFLAMPLACRHGFYIMHELLQEIRIGISLGFRFPLAARRYVRCAHMELQFLRNLGASCGPCVFPVASRFATGTPALPRYAPRSATMRGGLATLSVLNMMVQVVPCLGGGAQLL